MTAAVSRLLGLCVVRPRCDVDEWVGKKSRQSIWRNKLTPKSRVYSILRHRDPPPPTGVQCGDCRVRNLMATCHMSLNSATVAQNPFFVVLLVCLPLLGPRRPISDENFLWLLGIPRGIRRPSVMRKLFWGEEENYIRLLENREKEQEISLQI